MNPASLKAYLKALFNVTNEPVLVTTLGGPEITLDSPVTQRIFAIIKRQDIMFKDLYAFQ